MDTAPSPDFVEAVALVVGASGSLGAATAICLDGMGLRVALHAHREASEAGNVAAKLANSSLVVTADVRDWDSVRAMEAEVRSSLGSVSVLVNCAAIRRDGLMATQSPDEWSDVIHTNLIGAFHATRAVLPRMLTARSGRVINVVSPAGIVGNEGQTAYGASKSGIIGMTRSLALECGKRGVTVNALSPGFMRSRLTADVPEEIEARLVSRVPLRKITTPEEVAKGIRFLVECGYITGQVVSIDGGIS